MKIGKNEPCPCGSGRKYKKCCLNRPSEKASGLLTKEEAMYEQLMLNGRDERVRKMREATQVVSTRARCKAEWNSSKFDATRIELVVEEILNLSRELFTAANHSRQYWYQLIRRIAPLLWDELQALNPQAIGTPDWFTAVVKSAAHLALQCTAVADPWEWVDEDGTRGIDYRHLSPEDLVVAAQIFSLAQLCYEAQVRFRFACKGFRVFAASNEEDVFAAQDTRSITHYEERRERYDSLAGSAGLWCCPETSSPVRRDLCHWFGLSTAVADHFQPLSRNPQAEIGIQYLLRPATEIRLKPENEARSRSSPQPSFVPFDYLISHPSLARAFEAAFDVKAQELIAFLYAVFRMIYAVLRFPRLDFETASSTIEVLWEDETPLLRLKTLQHWKDVAELGLLRSGKDDWIERLVHESEQIHESDSSVPRLDNRAMTEFVDRFTWSDGIPLYSNLPLLFTRLSSHTLVLDGFSTVDFLRHLLLQPNLVGRDESNKDSPGDLTGPWLEDQAASFLACNLGLSMESLMRGKEVENLREIDIAFIYKRVLFVIDCKAMAKDAAFMEGQYSKIRNRISEMHKELITKIPHRVNLIKEGKAKGVIEPTAFDRVFGLVCTSAVEYLPLEESELWFNDVPLVGPPEELLESIKILSSYGD